MARHLLPILIALLLPAAAARADTIAADPAATQVTALDGTIVWVSGETQGQTLMQRAADGTIAPVAGSAEAAYYRSIDLGHDANGKLVLTYLRCTTLSRCTPVRDDLAGHRSTFKNLAPKNCALSTAPVQWGSRTAYGVACFTRKNGRKVADNARTGLYVRTGTGAAKRLATPRLARQAGAYDVTSVDLRGKNVAAVYADIAHVAVLERATGATPVAFRTGSSEGDTDQRTSGLALGGTTRLFALTQSSYGGEPAQTVLHRQTSACRDYQTLTSPSGPNSDFDYPAVDIAADGNTVYLVDPDVGIVSHTYTPSVGC
jgi:hypothetical protein